MTTIHDIAKLAGVSASTVSRVLNNHPYVQQEKVEAVQKAINETGYIQNIHAIHLKKGSTNLIGIVVPFLDQPYFSQLVDGIAKAVSKTDFHILIFQTQYVESKELEALELLKTKQIDSLIFCSRNVGLDVIKKYSSSGKIVLLEDVQVEGMSCTYMNHYHYFSAALEYLFEKNHNRIGICISRGNSTSSLQRKKAFEDFCERNQLPLNENDIFTDCLYLDDGMQLADKLFHSMDRPSALLVTNDQVAAGLYTASINLGWTVPDDIAIIGFDNQPISKALNMSTIHIPFNSVGEQLITQATQATISHHEIKLDFIERGTV